VTLFDRNDLVDSLRELVSELRAAGEPIGLRLVGGAALALRCFERARSRGAKGGTRIGSISK
jgi:hypothetical protein